MGEETTRRAAAKLTQGKVHWSVHAVDRIAGVGIRVGGLTVIFAVIGLVAFIFWQVVPLFSMPASGELEARGAPFSESTLALHTDEYRRVGVRVTPGGVAAFIVSTGESLGFTPVPDLGAAKVTAAHVALRPYTKVIQDGIADVPRFALTLGLSDGRVLQGYVSYVHAFRRFELNKDPESWRKLPMPERDEFGKPDFVPQVLAESEDGRPWMIEHLAEFGFYRRICVLVAIERTLELDTGGEAITRVHSSLGKGEPEAEREALTTVITQKGRALLLLEKLAFNAMTEQTEAEKISGADVSRFIKGPAALCLSHDQHHNALFATREGLLYSFERDAKSDAFAPNSEPAVNVFAAYEGESWQEHVAKGRARLELGEPGGALQLTAMEYLLGDTSVLLGDSHGGVQSWFKVRRFDEDVNPQFMRIHVFEPGAGAITGFAACAANKSFLAWDNGGMLRVFHNTAERKVFEERIALPGPAAMHYGDKAQGALAVDASGKLRNWWIDSKHSEVSFKTLFGKVWYEGYREPKYEWQSSSGTDDVEPKYSLVPLIVGTLKGGLYALLFAIPLAVLGAIYTSEFMHRKLRATVKPAMEVMASLPSVVLGFLGALYFAPLAAPIMPTLLVMVALCPMLFLFFGWVWQQLPPTITGKFGPLATLGLLIAILLLGIWGATIIGPRAEPLLFPAREAAAPELVSAESFKPIDKNTEARLDSGDLRSWTSGGALLQREQQGVLVAEGKPQSVKLPKGWWLPGGHGLFVALMVIPFALLVAWLFRAAGAVLFGGKLFKRELKGIAPGGNPIDKLRRALAGESRTTLWPVAIDVGFSLGFVGVVALLGLGLSLLVSPGIEYVFFGYEHPTAGGFIEGVATPARVADFRRFLTGAEGWKFNQTNSLVVGFAMGFAVIPIIYSIAEDALSTVPNQLRAASLACGASRWQTTVHVVVPAAASGIFSAIVIGLGRAIGETMIVVMAAGGTPVMAMEPLSGFRSLSAAIAIEMPEAPQGGSHYRTLFLGGLMLFCMTFVISSMAELVRMRLRKKLSRM